MNADAEGIPDDELIREFGLLLSATTRLERIAGRALERRAGITHVMFEVMLRLRDGCRSMSHLAQEMILTSGGMTRLVDRMEKAGLVVRATSPTDRRVQHASLTEQGREALDRAMLVHGEVLREFLAGPLTAEQRAVLRESLTRLEARGRKELPSLG
ncbi:MarR family winged helix-turn-helix transcriptional regulator [Actinocorallia populi]|uniref:MarR family winged helix-turn-helix transcriptional regulator n=1 Tax=Actinocorallia populi TaxID=2079200 RepID=UPI000D08845A|nr:MarR family transcriptional regulator [Actinocorallia populi]